MQEEKALDAYRELVHMIAGQAGTLFEKYRRHLACRRGCYFCCEAITILPVEMESVRRWMRRNARPGQRVQEEGIRPDEGKISVDRTAEGALIPPAHDSPPGAGAGTGDTAERCAMLDRHGCCAVYPARPIICRTHGLPLAYRVYEYDCRGLPVREDEPEYMDLWCDLNFRDLPDKRATAYFDNHGRINMDSVNIRLEEINSRFLCTPDGALYRGHGRLPLGWLL